MTIDSLEIVKYILEHDGFYPGDPWYVLIYEYTNSWGVKTHALFIDHAYDDLQASEFVRNPVLLMANGILTKAGEKWLEDNKHVAPHFPSPVEDDF